MCSRVKADLPRSNNPLEGFNNALNKAIGQPHPTIWTLIEAFQKEEASARLKMNHVARGDKVYQQKLYKDITEQLQELVKNYEMNGKKDRMTFLKMVSRKLKRVEVAESENEVTDEVTNEVTNE